MEAKGGPGTYMEAFRSISKDDKAVGVKDGLTSEAQSVCFPQQYPKQSTPVEYC